MADNKPDDIPLVIRELPPVSSLLSPSWHIEHCFTCKQELERGP